MNLKTIQKKQDITKNMRCCHFLLIAIVIMLIDKEFFNKTKISKMLLRIGFVILFIFKGYLM